MLAAELGQAEPSELAELADVTMPEARLLPDSVTRAARGRGCWPGTRIASAAPPARAIPTCSGRGARLETAPDAVVAAVGRAGGRGARGTRRRGRRPVRRRHQRGRRRRPVPRPPQGSDRARPPAPAPLRGRPHVAHSAARPRAAEARRRALAAEGLTLGHFPQSFEYATIGGFRRHALGRPGVGGLRALRRAGDSGRADHACRAAWRRSRRHTPPRDRRCESSSSAPRAPWG